MTKTILIVDDRKDDRKLVRLLLRKYECELVEAADGKEALEKIAAHNPRLVIMDHMMPEMTGYDCIHAIRQDPEVRVDHRLRSVPILLLTSKKFDEGFRQFMKMQGVEFLPKPVQSKTLLEKIQAVLGPLEPRKSAVPAKGARTGRFGRPAFGKKA